jgi:hypothetical protein
MVEHKTPENIPFKFDPPKLWGFILYNIGMLIWGDVNGLRRALCSLGWIIVFLTLIWCHIYEMG